MEDRLSELKRMLYELDNAEEIALLEKRREELSEQFLGKYFLFQNSNSLHDFDMYVRIDSVTISNKMVNVNGTTVQFDTEKWIISKISCANMFNEMYITKEQFDYVLQQAHDEYLNVFKEYV